jgi:hypothetical protein
MMALDCHFQRYLALFFRAIWRTTGSHRNATHADPQSKWPDATRRISYLREGQGNSFWRETTPVLSRRPSALRDVPNNSEKQRHIPIKATIQGKLKTRASSWAPRAGSSAEKFTDTKP